MSDFWGDINKTYLPQIGHPRNRNGPAQVELRRAVNLWDVLTGTWVAATGELAAQALNVHP